MIMTTPNEFLEFANEMGLGRIKPTESSSSALMSNNNNNNNNNCTTTGLSVLNNLCRLIEQIHELKSENNRLRAHIELVDHVQQFQQRLLLKHHHDNNKKIKDASILSSVSMHDEEKSDTLSPTNSLKVKSSLSNRERKGTNTVHQQYDSLSISHIEHDQNEAVDSSGSSPGHNRNNWSKVRHALKFTLRKKSGLIPSSPPVQDERKIPTISVSIESDDDHLNDNKLALKKKKLVTTTSNDNRQMITAEDTDQEDESNHMVRVYQKGRTNGNETPNLLHIERHGTSSTNITLTTSNIDDEGLLSRKPSKIARYRRKLRSKLDTVKKQFSDQNSSSIRLFHHSHGSIFDDIGSGLNRAILTAQIAPALTKSYQQKMREWEIMQKSQFLVNYRRLSIAPKSDFNSNSRKTSLIPTEAQASVEPIIVSSTMTDYPSVVDELNLELHTNMSTLGPTLSPNQRSLIVHQWREIMLEEISLRHYNDYLQKKMILLKELETNLKTLKTNIFCTNNAIKQQSVINIQQQQHSYLPERCRSLQSLITIPASWILAVQSAAYSDVLDGTSCHTTERAIFFNKQFFDQLEDFKRDREKFEQDSIKELQSLANSLTSQQTVSKSVQLNKTRARLILTRGCLRKLSLISYAEYPQYFLPDPVIPLQTVIAEQEPTSHSESLEISATEEFDSLSKSCSNHSNKQTKRSRFHLKQSFQRSKTLCINQLSLWLQRRRHQSTSTTRRVSNIEAPVHTSSSTISKIFASPRLARFHQRISRHQTPLEEQLNHTSIPLQYIDDSDNQSQYDLPVRIYLPPLTSPMPRHAYTNETNRLPPTDVNGNMKTEKTSNITMSSKTTKDSSSLKPTTARERRASFASLSNLLNNKC